MVAIRPFCALRYNPERTDDLSRVLSPPYDVIGAEEQEQLYQASPYNVVRLILGKLYPSDTETESRYTRARRDFDAWRAAGVLQRDAGPAIYVVDHAFSDGGAAQSRLGFIALLGLDEPIERAVYRHEATLAAPKQDRTKLLAAVPANLEPIFCVYPDEEGRVQTRLKTLARERTPTGHATLNGDAIRWWVVAEPSIVRELSQRLSSVSVLIADGHHRFEVAYANRARYGALMSYFVSMAEPALVVRPIHRVVQHEGAVNVQGLRDVCRLERAADLPALLRWLNDGADHGRFGCYDGQALYRATMTPEPLHRWLEAPAVAAPLASLDVSLLHSLVMPSLMPHGTTARYTYTADASQALRAVDRGEGRLAWLLRGIPLPRVYDLAAQGLSLPPKSTYFYPKVPSGLTINPFPESW